MTDKGEPGVDDAIGFSLYNGDQSDPNALWFSSNWGGTKTAEQVINGGNLVIHSGAALGGGGVVEVPKGKGKNKSAFITEVENNFNVHPNPFSDRLFFEFSRDKATNATLDLYDATGRKLQVMFNQRIEAKQKYRVEYYPNGLSTNMLFYRMTYDNEVINGKMIYKK